MTLRRFAWALTASIVVSVQAACTESAVTGTSPQSDRTGIPAASAPRTVRTTPATQQIPDDPGSHRQTDPSERHVARPTASAPVGAKPTRSTCVEDDTADLDRTGEPPGYADVVAACVRTAGSGLRLELEVAAPVPARMASENDGVTYSFELRPRTDATVYVVAHADREGWVTYLTRGNGRKRLRGAMLISDRRVLITVPRSELTAEARLAWKAESSWLRSGLVTTSYSFDSAPDRGRAAFRHDD